MQVPANLALVVVYAKMGWAHIARHLPGDSGALAQGWSKVATGDFEDLVAVCLRRVLFFVLILLLNQKQNHH